MAKDPTLFHLLKLANIGGIKKQKALEIIDEVKRVVSNWKTFAEQAGVSSASLKMIQTVIDSVSKKAFF